MGPQVGSRVACPVAEACQRSGHCSGGVAGDAQRSGAESVLIAAPVGAACGEERFELELAMLASACVMTACRRGGVVLEAVVRRGAHLGAASTSVIAEPGQTVDLRSVVGGNACVGCRARG